MMRSAATIAIVRVRLQKEAPMLALIASACALVAYLQRFDDAQAQFAGCLVFGTLAGSVVALIQRGYGRFREIELCEQSAPLFGRELARATALVPCIVVSVAVAAYWGVNAFYARLEPAPIVLSALAINAATLAALCATVRIGAKRAVCIGAAIAIALAAFALSKTPIALASGVCVVFGFIALRQYGEELARYDPIRF